jgi:VIT1/CCC1 family predicted Fe2+/Mn2+ transporter
MSLPASTTYPQMITPGTASAIVSPPHPSQNAPMNPYMVKNVLKNIMTYVSIFGAVFLVSLSQVQSLLLRYIPNSYAGSGVVSLTGAAVLGAVGATAGGAPMTKAVLRVTFWGAVAMAITAVIGRLFGAVV